MQDYERNYFYEILKKWNENFEYTNIDNEYRMINDIAPSYADSEKDTNFLTITSVRSKGNDITLENWWKMCNGAKMKLRTFFNSHISSINNNNSPLFPPTKYNTVQQKLEYINQLNLERKASNLTSNLTFSERKFVNATHTKLSQQNQKYTRRKRLWETYFEDQ